MKIDEIKNKILQLAIQGKLVPQDENDEPAAVLLEKIKAEKEKLIKEKKIKKEKSLPEISEEEKEFELPDGWEWVRLGNIATIRGGKRVPSGYKLQDELTSHIYIRVANMKDSTIVEEDIKYISDDVYDMIKNYYIESKDIYITIAGTIGRVGVVPSRFDGANLTENAAKISFYKTNKDYIAKIMNSSYVQSQIESRTKKVGQPKLALNQIEALMIPLPPLEEQKRIVAKVDELFAIVDQLSENKEAMAKCISDTRNKVLQLAIQGKLVEQDVHDEPASVLLERIREEKEKLIKGKKIKKEKPLPEISEEEKLFEIPLGWEWIRLGDFISFVGGNQPPKSTFKYEYQEGYIRLIQIRDYKSDRHITYIPLDKAKRFCNSQEVMIGRYGPPIFQILRGIEGAYNVALMKADPIAGITKDYLFYLLKDPVLLKKLEHLASRTCGQDGIDMKTLKEYPIGLPPIKEQERIVTQIIKLMTYLDHLEQALLA